MTEQNDTSDEWPFEDGPSTPAFTTSYAIVDLSPIVHVVRGADGDWQFLSAEGSDESALKIVALKTVLSRHPDVKEIGGLQLGWEAWRSNREAPWSRRQIVGR